MLANVEAELLLRLCRAWGLDHGELDVLRDVEDGKLHDVDVNNTPWVPNHLDKKEVPEALKKLSKAFATSFIRDRLLPVFAGQKDPLALFPFRLRKHYNEEGNRVVAEEMLKFINGSGRV